MVVESHEKAIFRVLNNAERDDPGALLGALGGDAVCERLAHGDAAHLANQLAVPVARPVSVAQPSRPWWVNPGAWGQPTRAVSDLSQTSCMPHPTTKQKKRQVN